MPETILITGARAPVALHLARVMTAAGHKVILADSQRFPLSRATRFKHAFHRLPKPVGGLEAYGTAVETLINREQCSAIIPTCEEIFFLAAWRDLYERDLPLIAPPFETLKAVHNKFTFAEMVKDYAVTAPQTALLTSKKDLEEVAADASSLVFKPVWSRFGNRVLLRPDPGQAAGLSPTVEQPWIAQQYLPGEELCTWAFLREGTLKAQATYRPLYRAGIGAAVAFGPVDQPAIRRFVSDFGRDHNWNGHLAFDFRRGVNGRLHVLECNPRATSGVHFFGPRNRLADAVMSDAQAKPDVFETMTLPLAMLVYGLPAELREDGLSGFRKWKTDISIMADLSKWPGDRSLFPMQLLSLAEISARALRNRSGLVSAATSDIEWNGEDLSPDHERRSLHG